MGLDMYVVKRRKNDEFRDENLEEVAYWRKANQIHNWFVQNVQEGVDDCNYYEVSKDNLERLLKICRVVKENSELIKGKVNNGYTFEKNENGEFVKKYFIEDGYVIKDTIIAKELLPCVSGFFFGNEDYDEYYYRQIENTIKQLEKILKETNFDEELIEYSSSW